MEAVVVPAEETPQTLNQIDQKKRKVLLKIVKRDTDSNPLTMDAVIKVFIGHARTV